MLEKLRELALRLRSVVIFRQLAQGEVLSKLDTFLHALDENGEKRVGAYCAFVGALYEKGWDFSRYLLQAAAETENPYVRLVLEGKPIPAVLEECMESELQLLGELSALGADALIAAVGCRLPLPRFESSKLDFAAEYRAGIAEIGKKGFGIFAQNVMFCWREGEIAPVYPADDTKLCDLTGYERERQEVLLNTRALAAGLPAANVLLYGDAGTGKSTTVKAVVNELAQEGVRLIELKKEQMRDIPRLMEQLRDNPLKFVLFLDDLSFQQNDDGFSGLKAVLEGSSCKRAANVAIYATSNRRHLVKETFTEREGQNDVHLRDTIQETASLAERFGLSVYFAVPGKALYLEIVRALAAKKGITLPEQELELKAEAFALAKGGRSARAAEQFTDGLACIKL